MRAVVMAGGQGTRLRPLTSNMPKPMVPVVNKPTALHILELLSRHGIHDVVMTVAFMPQLIQNYFGDGSTFGMRIDYSVEEAPLGTAGSVKNAQAYLDDTFLVISGDGLTDFDLTAILDFHRKRDAMVTIALKSVDNPLEFGVVIVDEHGRIERFLEKPGWGQVFSDTINTGIYVLEPEVLDHIPRGDPVRLQPSAVSPPLRGAEAPVRRALRRLLAGHRESPSIPPGEQRRARREGPGEPARGQVTRQRLGGSGRGFREPRQHTGAGPDRRLHQCGPGRVHRGAHRPWEQRGRQGRGLCGGIGDRRRLLPGARSAHAGGDRGIRGRHPCERGRR